MLHVARNIALSDNTLIQAAVRRLRERMPPGWSLRRLTHAKAPHTDATVELVAPDRRKTVLTMEAKARLDPKGARDLGDRLQPGLRGPLLVIAPYLSDSTRSQLRDRELSYLDLTGNVRVLVSEPGLYIEALGATEDPNREQRPARSLRGAKAGRIIRALINYGQPPGVRELAGIARVDAGYVSRVLSLLDSEALITRTGRGRIERVDWPALIRRWAQEAPLESRGQSQMFLEPRGVSALVARLKKAKEQYVVTGTLAAAALAPIAPTRLATLWMRDATDAANRLGLRPADAGANVLILDPIDDGVFDNALERDGLWCAPPSQVAADLLSSPGRGPAEAEELLTWMIANEQKWRL